MPRAYARGNLHGNFEISINFEGLRQEFRIYSPKVSPNTKFFLSDAYFRPDFSPAH